MAQEPERAATIGMAKTPDFAERGPHGRTAGPALPVVPRRFERARRSGGVAEPEYGQFAVATVVLCDELRTERHRAGGGHLPEVDLVGRPLSEALVRPLLVEPADVGAQPGLDRADGTEEMEAARVLDLHGLPPPLDDREGPVSVHGPVAMAGAERAQRASEDARRELLAVVGDDVGGRSERARGLSHEPRREQGRRLPGCDSESEHLPREPVHDRAHDDGAEDPSHAREVQDHTWPGRLATSGPRGFRAAAGDGRFGLRRRNARTLVRETAIPRRASTPAMRRVPHFGHSRRKRRTRSATRSGSWFAGGFVETRGGFSDRASRRQLMTARTETTNARAVLSTDRPNRAAW